MRTIKERHNRHWAGWRVQCAQWRPLGMCPPRTGGVVCKFDARDGMKYGYYKLVGLTGMVKG